MSMMIEESHAPAQQPQAAQQAIILMLDPHDGNLTVQHPPQMPPEAVLHLLHVATEAVDAAVRRQNSGLLLPRKKGNGLA
jgi:hypothetical protein